MRCFDVITGL